MASMSSLRAAGLSQFEDIAPIRIDPDYVKRAAFGIFFQLRLQLAPAIGLRQYLDDDVGTDRPTSVSGPA